MLQTITHFTQIKLVAYCIMNTFDQDLLFYKNLNTERFMARIYFLLARIY